MELASVSAFVALCNTVISTGQKLYKEQWTSKEERIVATAAHTGIVELIQIDGLLAVYADRTVFSGNDRLVTATYLDAFRHLCERGSLVPERDGLFTLTGEAIEHSRRLAVESQTFDKRRVGLPYVPYLSDIETKLLLAAYCSPQLNNYMLFNGKVRTGAVEFFSGSYLETLEALESFCNRGWAREFDSEHARIFRLTHQGSRLLDVLMTYCPKPLTRICE